MDDKDHKLSLFLDAWGQDNIELAQEVLTEHNWDVESALLAISQLEGGNPSPRPPAASAAPHSGVDQDGYRSPMRTGYTDTLIGPDPGLAGMGFDEQAAILATMSGGHVAPGANLHPDMAWQAMQQSQAEYERVAEHQEQGHLAHAMQASYAMHMAEEQQRIASYHDADRAEQQEMARAIEASYKEQSLAEERYRADLERAARESVLRSTPTAAASSRGPVASQRRLSRPGTSSSSNSRPGQLQSGRELAGLQPPEDKPPLPRPHATAGAHEGNRLQRSSPSYPRDGGSKELSSAIPSQVTSRERDLHRAPPLSTSSALPSRHATNGTTNEEAPRRPSKPVVPPSGLRTGPPPPHTNPQARVPNAGAASAARVASATRSQNVPCQPTSSSSSTSTANRAPRPGVSMLSSMIEHPATPLPRRGVADDRTGVAPRTPGSSSQPSVPSPVKLEARIQYTGSNKMSPSAASGAAVAPKSSAERMGLGGYDRDSTQPLVPPGRGKRGDEDAMRAQNKQQIDAEQLAEARGREAEEKRRREAALGAEQRQRQPAAETVAKQQAEVDRQRQLAETKRQQDEAADERRRRQLKVEAERLRKLQAESEQRKKDADAAAAKRREAALTAAAAASKQREEQEQQEQERKRIEAKEAEELRREAEQAAQRQQDAVKGEEKGKDEVVLALGQLWKTHRDQNAQALAACLSALRAYIGNLAKNPQDPKFQRINVENSAFKTRVAALEGGVAVLLACGFQPDETGALVVGEAFIKSKGPKLFSALDKLNVMLDQLNKA
mmetsp:Transcript_171/g.565  ORF Transcript_171/g.565 Transcript_171/m.565 type:complete len:783 (-) Transcript_171:107-2455(-)